MNFGDLLEQLRVQRGLTKKELALRARLSAGYVSLLINGVKQHPSVDVTSALAAALELSTDELRSFWQVAGYDQPLKLSIASRRAKLISQPAAVRMATEAAGILGVHQGLPLDLVQQWLSEVNRYVRIQDTWMVDSLLSLEHAFLAASKDRGAQLQILLLADGPLASQRSRDVWPPGAEPIDEHYVAKKVQANIGELKRWSAKGVKLQVRLYQAVPCFQLLMCDDRALIGFYRQSERASEGPQIEIAGMDALFARFVTEEFDKLWEQAETAIDNINQ